MGTVNIKYNYDHPKESNTCIENMYHGVLVPIMFFTCGKNQTASAIS